MSLTVNQFYRFGEFAIDTDQKILLRGDHPLPLTPKVFETLLILVENHGRVVEKEALMRRLWPDTFVEDANLTFNIQQIRKALGDDARHPVYIETVPRRGYRFIAAVEEVLTDASAANRHPTRRYETTGEQMPDSVATASAHSARESAAASGLPGAQVSSTRPDGFAAEPAAAPRATGISKRSVALVAALLVVLTGGALLAFKLIKAPARPAAVTSYNNWEVVRLTRTGGSVHPAISPDGRFVAYVQSESERESVWIRQLATSTEQQLLPPEMFNYSNLCFLPDGSELYFTRRESPSALLTLYRMPILGGVPKKLRDDIQEQLTLSPDGKNLAFTRRNRENKTEFVISNADGVEERVLTSGVLPFPAWSPDGKVIVYSEGSSHTGADSMSVFELRLEDSTTREVTPRKWNYVSHKSWLSDGTGLIVSARDAKTGVNQLWFVAYPSGETRPLSDDLQHLNRHSLTADAGTLVAEQYVVVSDIWSVPLSDPAGATKVGFWGRGGLSLLRGGRILYTSLVSGENYDIWVMNGDSTGRKQLTFDDSNDIYPVATPDERHIIFISSRSGDFEVWRMNADGSNPVQLTYGKAALTPSLTPDGQWVVYRSGRDGNIWKVPVEGGESVRVVESGRSATVSPNGKLIAYFVRVENGWQIAVKSFAEGGAAVRKFAGPSPALNDDVLQWTADGKALLYASRYEGVGNVWRQPLDGNPPRKVTDFKSDGIFSFDVSADGKTLVCARGGWKHDIVLIRGIKP